jgi:hypothetical protein
MIALITNKLTQLLKSEILTLSHNHQIDYFDRSYKNFKSLMNFDESNLPLGYGFSVCNWIEIN